MAASQVRLKTVFTVALGTLLVVAAVFAILNSLLAITLTSAALLLALALEHGVKWLVRRHLPRLASIAVVSVLLLAFVTGIGFTLIPPIVSQGKALVDRAPEYVHKIKHSAIVHRLDDRLNINERIEDAEKDATRMVAGAAPPVLAAVGGVLSFVGAVISVFFLTVFMLVFGGPLVAAALRQMSHRKRQTAEAIARQIYQSVGGYIAGLALICSVNATCTTIFLAINRVPFFLPLAVFSGLSSTIPYAGPVVAGAAISVLSFLTGGLWHGIATVIYFVVYGQIEGNILGPLIFRRAVRVDPLMITLSILFLGEIGGVAGAVVAVPLVATVQVILRELLALRAAETFQDPV